MKSTVFWDVMTNSLAEVTVVFDDHIASIFKVKEGAKHADRKLCFSVYSACLLTLGFL
jgi:hypothetical protein